ncbi:NADPH-dependent FMN reductase [Chitinophaga sp. 22321]|uniref:NAD(P)H-dependent oxidoreductase n=1 Tax=Chitinophaga hostae TaxID=2831022 RepID=A0ABS5J4N3_9BACT|nr:NADPH-dependent FMN reductase [Chitinophaga hostae]MBS0030168.1 NAD(P)H-dependent oxidoreductase [Chitinophaga hostae]
MNVLIFNGAIDDRPYATSNQLAAYLTEQLQAKGFSPEIFSLGSAQIPFFSQQEAGLKPPAVDAMCKAFCKADLHIWMTPLYHGSMTGAMKNCLDWLEMTSKNDRPYLTGKVVALLSWADGTQAMQGINAMDAVAKALRAWVLPYSLPILKDNLYNPQGGGFTAFYKNKLDTMVQLLCAAKAHVVAGIEG